MRLARALHDENETRVIEINLDESAAQTQAILRRQADDAAASPTDRLKLRGDRAYRTRLWQAALAALQPHEVRIPTAHALAQASGDTQNRPVVDG